MYRDDETAQSSRASALIDEIARLEREKLALASTDRRLEEARRELASFQPAAEPPARAPGLAVHLAVYGLSALATFAVYTLLFP
ncbi:MAG: hypothetical protein IPI49_23020 [Myxococcales bacterium]|nr:hypothetical protein [Myxococcales bacterium]HRC58938.1 hypothetical protein [Kofleriaceae bacterium]